MKSLFLEFGFWVSRKAFGTFNLDTLNLYNFQPSTALERTGSFYNFKLLRLSRFWSLKDLISTLIGSFHTELGPPKSSTPIFSAPTTPLQVITPLPTLIPAASVNTSTVQNSTVVHAAHAKPKTCPRCDTVQPDRDDCKYCISCTYSFIKKEEPQQKELVNADPEVIDISDEEMECEYDNSINNEFNDFNESTWFDSSFYNNSKSSDSTSTSKVISTPTNFSAIKSSSQPSARSASSNSFSTNSNFLNAPSN